MTCNVQKGAPQITPANYLSTSSEDRARGNKTASYRRGEFPDQGLGTECSGRRRASCFLLWGTLKCKQINSDPAEERASPRPRGEQKMVHAKPQASDPSTGPALLVASVLFFSTFNR